MPGPPPPAPPPPSFSIPKGGGSGGADGRSALLQSIQQGKKLKKTVTVDKSGPMIPGDTCKKSTDPYAFEESSSDSEFEVPGLEQISAFLEHEPMEGSALVDDSLQLDVSTPENSVLTVIKETSSDPYISSENEFKVPGLEKMSAFFEREPTKRSALVDDSLQLDVSTPENPVITVYKETSADPYISSKNDFKVPELEQISALLDHESAEGTSLIVDNSLQLDLSKPENLVLTITEETTADPYIDSENTLEVFTKKGAPSAPKVYEDKQKLTNVTNHSNGLQIPSTSKQVALETNDYMKKPSARERPLICPICFKDVNTHFTRHLFRHHKNHNEVKLLAILKPNSKERLAHIASLRKQGYFILKTEKNVTHAVKSSKKIDAEYFVCNYCLGQYTKQLLFKHVKKCKNKPRNDMKSTKNCLAASQTLMAIVNSKNSEFLQSSRVKNEVFCIMRPDDISAIAKSDQLICLYGESLLSKHKRQQIVNVVSNKMRELGRLIINLKKAHEISGLFDVLRPEFFRHLVQATKDISGYDINTKSFKAPSLALHMGTNLKVVCDVAYKLVVEKRDMPGIKWNDQQAKKNEIKDLKKLIEGHWNNELSSLALKNLKEKHWENPLQLPLSSDLKLFNDYLNKLAEESYCQLRDNMKSKFFYKQLTNCVLAKTIIFNRKRVGDVQYVTIENYNRDFSTINQDSFLEALTEVEKIICKNHKRIVTGGKGSKPVPILFATQTQKYINCLLQVRRETDIVPKTNSYLFANPDSHNRWMSGANAIRNLAKECGAEHPFLLTSTRFRKHIATTLQLMSMNEDEMEQIATFMGHTKKTHAEFYRLPQDIYQTSKVAKVLLLIEKGRGHQFRGKKLDDIDMDTDVYYSSESESDELTVERTIERVARKKRSVAKACESENTPVVNDGQSETKRVSENEDLGNKAKGNASSIGNNSTTTGGNGGGNNLSSNSTLSTSNGLPLGGLFAGGMPKLKATGRLGSSTLNSSSSNINNNETDNPSPKVTPSKNFSSIQDQLKKQLHNPSDTRTRGPPPPAPTRNLSIDDSRNPKPLTLLENSSNGLHLSQTSLHANLSSLHNSNLHRKSKSNANLSSLDCTDSVNNSGYQPCKPVINHGKPNLAPKPPVLNGKPAPPSKLIMKPNKPISRAQSMRSPRSPSPQSPTPNNDAGVKFGTVRNMSSIIGQSLANSQNSQSPRQRPPLTGRPSVPPPSVPPPAAPTKANSVKPPSHAPPPPPSVPQPPNHAPPPPPHKTLTQSLTQPVRPPPAVPTNNNNNINPPPPPPRHSSMRDVNQTSRRSGVDLEEKFKTAFNTPDRFPRPPPYRNVLKLYTNRQATNKQQAPLPPQIQPSNRIWNPTSTC